MPPAKLFEPLDFLLLIGVEFIGGGPAEAGAPECGGSLEGDDDDMLPKCSASSCLFEKSANPRICKDSASLIKAGSIGWATLVSPLYMYSTRDLRLSNSISLMTMTGCLSFRY